MQEENTILKKIKGSLGLIVLGLAFLASCIAVFYNHVTMENPNIKTIRICHWQLEAGFRQALDVIIDDYQKEYKKRTGKTVRIIQVPVATKGYPQFINTGLIGNMAPDIIEMGIAGSLNNFSNIVRYFLPLGKYVRKKNPYNAGTPLAGVPWKDSFFDDLQGNITPELQEYYKIPFSVFTRRIYYNKELLKKINGSDKFPESYVDFIALCEKTLEYSKKTGENIIPVAACKNQLDYVEHNFKSAFVADLVRRLDSNHNMVITAREAYIAYLQKKWNFNSPEILNVIKSTSEVTKFFMPGWVAANRDDSAFVFVQGRALMTASGSWDAKSLIDQSKGVFEVGIAKLPYPTDHPEYGKYVKGGVNEASIRGGIPWGVNKASKHIDVCIDFLRFATTRVENEKFNNLVYWVPVVKGTKTKHKFLKEFAPILDGYSASFTFAISTQYSIISGGDRWLLYAGRITPEQYAANNTAVYEKTSPAGFKKQQEKAYRILRSYESVITGDLIMEQIGSVKQQVAAKERLSHLTLIAARQTYFYHVYNDQEKKSSDKEVE
jgi:raffinose/stachyose/melibiose transport system substrate-binding protein